MWLINLKGAVAHRLRYGMTALAVLIGVAFIAGTLILTDTIHATFNSIYDQIYQSTGAVVRAEQSFQPTTNFTHQRQRIDASLATTVAKAPGVKAVATEIEGYAQLVGRNGKVIGSSSSGLPTLGLAWINNAALDPLRLLPGGHPPRTSSQVVIDEHSADVGNFRVGDSVKVLTQVPPAIYTIVGIATWGTASSPLGATITAFDPITAARVLGQPGKVDQIEVQGQPGVSQASLVRNVQSVIHNPSLEVVSGQSVTQEGQNAAGQVMSAFNSFLLVFAAVALLVAAFLIFNTFSIIVTQRTRELALLRAVGASRSQVTGSVIGEALVVGLVASAAGLGAGLALALGLRAGLNALGLGLAIPSTGLVVSLRTVLVAMLVGTAITIASAVIPGRRAARVPPIVAMRGEAPTPEPLTFRRLRRGIRWTIIGVVLVVVGTFFHTSNNLVVVVAGAFFVLVGLRRLGPVVSRPIIAVLGAPFARRGATGQLARENAMRNVSRTTTTAASLMIGVALMSVMAIFASSIKASTNAAIASTMKADFVISSGSTPASANGLSPSIEQSLATLPQVSTLTGVRSSDAQIYGKTTTVYASDLTKTDTLFDLGAQQGSIASISPTGVAISRQAATQHHLHLGSPVYITFPATGRKSFTVQDIFASNHYVGDYELTLAAATANFSLNLDYQIYLKLAPGVTSSAGRSAIERVLAPYPNATLMNEAQFKAQQSQSVNTILNLSYALLIFTIVIALIGIANTLALSIYERIRELGLLRAVGMTRGQLRSTVRVEALIISVLGVLEGLVLGLILGVAYVRALNSQGVTHLSVPVLELLILAVVAALAGGAAAGPPARRAAHLNVLEAVTTE